MNWFERYGIVGTYFLGILSLALFGLNYFNFSDTKTIAEAVIALFVFLILPVGYIICLFSQHLYYAGANGEQIHKSIVDEFNDDEQKDLGISKNDKEKEIEVILTVKHRLAKDCSQMQFLSSFATKRWDFLALNGAIMFSTVLFYLILFVLILAGNGFNFSSRQISVVSVSIIWGLILLVILSISDERSRFQIKEVNRAMIKKVLEEQKKIKKNNKKKNPKIPASHT